MRNVIFFRRGKRRNRRSCILSPFFLKIQNMFPETASRDHECGTCPPLFVTRRWKYFRRILKYNHMDFQFALWQMVYLCTSPSKVYRNFHYHKYTKNQWARDDPAFLVLLSIWLLISSGCFSIVLGLHFLGFLKFFLWLVLIDCIAVGLVISSLLWYVFNKYLRIPKETSQSVEWGYAFDVHLNAFFPLLIILHVIQLFFINFISSDSTLSRILGNTLWLIALVCYIYITFLGFSALPFLRGTVIILYPLIVLLVGYILSIVFNYNIAQQVLDFYKYRVV